MRSITFLCLWICFIFNLSAQHNISGVIYDACNNELAGILVSIANKHTISNAEGMFRFENLPSDNYTLEINGLEFKKYSKFIYLNEDTHLKINLENSTQNITSVLIEQRIYKQNSVKSEYIEQNFGGSLMQSLEHISGINSQNIGATLSKPILRGFGLHRAVVLINTSKHEGQQWGVDHGLEIDAFSVEKISLIKGGAAIKYGNDAIGGVLITHNNSIPKKHTENLKLSLIGRSINQTIGGFADYKKRNNNIFYKIKLSFLDFADFKTTTDTIVYLTRKIPLQDKYLKNTAGTQANIFGQIGYVNPRVKSIFSISHNYSKSGFYPGSHGIPNMERLQDDYNKRNVAYPYQATNHSMLQHEFEYTFNHSKLHLENSFQRNERNEMSLFHTHYPNQLPPADEPSLELGFRLKSFNSNLNYELLINDNQTLNIGGQFSILSNDIKGYSFFLPKYDKHNLGIYALYQVNITPELSFVSGLRYDYVGLKISKMYDQNLYDYLLTSNYSAAQAEEYALRSNDLKRKFKNINYKIALDYQITNRLKSQLTIGSVLRNPTAIELGVNGIHHGAFRHEKGNPDLENEKGILFDLNTEYRSNRILLEVNPYLYYFSNYIYLNPTGTFSILPHSGQIYQYNQARALSSGLELNGNIDLEPFEFIFSGEYIYNKQLNNNFPLPFTPALNVFGRFNYNFDKVLFRKKNNIQIYVDTKYYAPQNNVALNEAKTPSSILFGCGINNHINLDKHQITFTLNIQNVFNTKYFNHTSYYRTLNIPEPSRNIQFVIQYQF
ncbi:MAG: TonB-dependent receptor [Bacteroidota bacterium]|nr:TonB-dependent receptor [Bacteroidota bacterium]